MRGWLGWGAKLYPKAWRERYGQEFGCLLEDVEPRWTDVVDVLRGAVMMQIGAWSRYLKLVGAVTAAGAIVAVVASFVLPGLYVSSAVVQAGRADDPQTFNRIMESWQDVVSRSSLAELIQRPNLDLYKGERNRQPLEDVIEDMKRKGLKVEVLKDSGAFRISFVYPDRFKARAVVDALTQKVRDASRAGWIAAPASLPQSPVAPDRLAFTIWGLGIGLVAGVITSFFRWRATWTMKVLGFGLAVCLIVAGLARLLPNRYTSSATLRVIPAPGADGVKHYMQEGEMAVWLQKKEREILSDESLYEIIQRRSVDLYHKEREDQPVAAVVAIMRRDLRVEAPNSHSAFTIFFTYADRFKAQQVVSALVTKFADSEVVLTEADLMAATSTRREGSIDDCIGKTRDAYVGCITAHLGPIFPAAEKARARRMSESIELLDPASLPETPVGPNRFVLAGASLFVGLSLGAYVLRGKPTAGLRHA